MKACPHCGAVLPDEASFCPNCAESVVIRQTLRRFRRLPVKAAFVLFSVLAAALLEVLIRSLLPGTYDNGTAEALYDLRGRTYQLCIAWGDMPDRPFSDRYTSSSVNFDGRYPALLFINDADTGEDAVDGFLPQVESVTAEFTGPGAGAEDLRLSCTPPARETDYVPNAASITYVDFCLWRDGDYEAQLLFTVTMKNGDVIRVRQTHHFHAVKTYTYTPEDAPMNTLEDLRALLEEISRTAEPDADINIHLPPVTYAGELVLNRLAVNLTGSVDQAGRRTALTGPVHLTYSGGAISYFEGIDFTGSGGGTGISALSRLHLTNCRLSGWDTAVFCSEQAWVNADQCIFSDNGVGLHINNAEPNLSDSRFEGNTFQGNGTALVLEQVGVDLALSFPGTLFTGPGADIDNRCGQELDLSRTVFQ